MFVLWEFDGGWSVRKVMGPLVDYASRHYGCTGILSAGWVTGFRSLTGNLQGIPVKFKLGKYFTTARQFHGGVVTSWWTSGNDLVSEKDNGLSFSLSVEFRFRGREKRGFEKSAISSGLTNGDRLFSIADRRLRLLWQIERGRESFGCFWKIDEFVDDTCRFSSCFIGFYFRFTWFIVGLCGILLRNSLLDFKFNL